MFWLALAQSDVASTRPADRLEVGWWKERHERRVETTLAGRVDVVFLGDSITQGWEAAGKDTWARTYAGRNAANFGFSGDRTEHVLWRLDNGEIIGLDPKLVVVMIGTNNLTAGHSPSDTVHGIRAVVGRLLAGLPRAKVLLLGVFPRARDAGDPLRVRVADVNAGVAAMADGQRVFYHDMGTAFTRRDGELRYLLMPDALHLSASGYEVWAYAIERSVRRLLGESPP